MALSDTHERLTLGANFKDDTVAEHVKRYTFAAKLVAGLDVIDVACGSGYGSQMLGRAGARSVRAFDISRDAIEYAREHYACHNVTFEVGDATSLRDVPNDWADSVISFETIEHIEDDQAYVNEMHRVLKPGGRFIVSTPDRRLSSVMHPLRRRPSNSFHVREYTMDELITLLKTRFSIEQVYGQAFIRRALVFWPVQISLKGICFALRRFNAYEFIRDNYHIGSGLDVQCRTRFSEVARYWVVACQKA
jgi:O-antigen biosynthesis protein